MVATKKEVEKSDYKDYLKEKLEIINKVFSNNKIEKDDTTLKILFSFGLYNKKLQFTLDFLVGIPCEDLQDFLTISKLHVGEELEEMVIENLIKKYKKTNKYVVLPFMPDGIQMVDPKRFNKIQKELLY